MIKSFYKSLTQQPLLLINSFIEGFLGLWMILLPYSIQVLGAVEISLPLIQTCGLLALSVAAFSKLGAFYIYKSKDPGVVKKLVYLSLAIFNSTLTIGLFYGAISGDINYIGVIIHLPLAILFTIGAITISKRPTAL